MESGAIIAGKLRLAGSEYRQASYAVTLLSHAVSSLPGKADSRSSAGVGWKLSLV